MNSKELALVLNEIATRIRRELESNHDQPTLNDLSYILDDVASDIRTKVLNIGIANYIPEMHSND